MRHRYKFCEDRSNRSGNMADFRFFMIFYDGRRPPSWICFTRVGTTHEVYLVVFVTVQNLPPKWGTVCMTPQKAHRSSKSVQWCGLGESRRI